MPSIPRAALAIPVAALALAAAACGGSGDPQAATTVATTGTTATATTTTAATLASAAAEFTELVTPLNAEVRQINADIATAKATDDVSAVVAPLERLSAATRTFTTGLRTIAVPASVQRQVDDLLASAVAQQGALDALIADAKAGSLPPATAQTWTAALFQMSGRAAVLRNALGLPPAG